MGGKGARVKVSFLIFLFFEFFGFGQNLEFWDDSERFKGCGGGP